MALPDQYKPETDHNIERPPYPMDIIPGENPLQLRYIDFEGQHPKEVVMIEKGGSQEHENIFLNDLPVIEEEESYAKYCSARISTTPLHFADLLSPELEISDIITRTVRTRFFHSKEKRMVIQIKRIPEVSKSSIPITTENPSLGRLIGQQYGTHEIVESFSFGKNPSIANGDFDLTHFTEEGINYEAYASLAFRMFTGETSFAKLFKDENPNRLALQPEALKTAMESLLTLPRINALIATGQIEKDNIEDFFLWTSNFLTALALTNTTSSQRGRLTLNLPYSLTWSQNQPAIDTIPYIAKAFSSFFSFLPSIIKEGQYIDINMLDETWVNLTSQIRNTLKNSNLNLDGNYGLGQNIYNAMEELQAILIYLKNNPGLINRKNGLDVKPGEITSELEFLRDNDSDMAIEPETFFDAIQNIRH